MPFALLQQAADQLGANLFGGAAEEGSGKEWEFLDGRGGYGGGSCFSTLLSWVQHSRTAAETLNTLQCSHPSACPLLLLAAQL